MNNRQFILTILVLLGALLGICLAHFGRSGFNWERDHLLVFSVTASALGLLVGGATVLAFRRSNRHE
ncbi:hypothetical protein ADIS_4239 [Lunatimonas lonarensis]|uniref:Uncharacterized protein n=1 Tax=Lunatimonas lonarensis TaxID=1232681 RepID=R7ZMJ7_9BACT|nr:hypothetical protein [Lunatimonas lonarensis]EON75326.1 hypothetical protein ADIS_4239 [Lunatimonas lonarensis]